MPSSRCPADHIHSADHQSRVPHEWSRCPTPLELDRLLADAHRAAHAAGDLIPRRHAVCVGLAERLPHEVERHRDRLAVLAAQQRGRIVVRARRRRRGARGSARAAPRTRARRAARRLRRVSPLAGGQRRGEVDHRDRRALGPAHERRDPRDAEVRVEPEPRVQPDAPVGGDRVEVPALVPQLLGARRVARPRRRAPGAAPAGGPLPGAGSSSIASRSSTCWA